jgi:hypothetical protein
VHGELELGVRVRHDLRGPRVRADQHDLALDEITPGVEPDAGCAAAEAGVVDEPQRSPARVHEHDVARVNFRALPFECADEIGACDLVATPKHRHTLESRDVDQHAARRQRADVLDAELREPVAAREVGAVVAVVEHVADADVPEPVELRADLAELGAHDLVVIHRAIRPHGAIGLRNAQAEMAGAEQRHPGFVRAAELVHGAARDEVAGLEHLGRSDAVGRAALVVGAPARGVEAIGLARRDTRCDDGRSRGDQGGENELAAHVDPPEEPKELRRAFGLRPTWRNPNR